jgi:hypothetical protein
MKNIFWTIRYQKLNDKIDLWQINLNWNYTPSFYINNSFRDRINQNIITNLNDMIISEEKYTGNIPIFDNDWNPTGETHPILDRFFFISFNDKINPAYWITESIIVQSIEQIWNQFAIKINWIEEIKAFIKNMTNLEEIEDWKFLLSEDEFWKKRYLNIIEVGDVITNE